MGLQRQSILIYIYINKADYAETSIPISEQNVRASSTIKVLNDEEIEGMRKVCKVRLLPLWWIECIALIGWLYWIKISREVLDIGAAAIRPGISTDEIGKL